MRAVRSPLCLSALALFVAACGTEPRTISAPDAGKGEPAPVGTVTAAGFGPILVGPPSGMALYTKAGDSATSSTCTGTCATTWPPLTVPLGQQAVGGPGVDGMFGTLRRSDGTVQATYNGLPLYFYQGDTKPGVPTGNGLDGFSVATP